MKREEIIAYFSDIMCEKADVCGFISKNSSEHLFAALEDLESKPLSKVQFDQLLSLQHLKCMSDDFFRFYWLQMPDIHFYRIEKLELNEKSVEIESIAQLKWGFNRLFIDCLFVFGNIQRGYEELCDKSKEEIEQVFRPYLFNTEQIKSRGNTLHFEDITKEDRYLISEMACKTFSDLDDHGRLIEKLIESYKTAIREGVTRPTFRMLLEGKYYKQKEEEYVQMSLFPQYCFEELMDDEIASGDDIETKARTLANRFSEAHRKAIKNTELYLSLVNDLDVYVATSMRTKDDFTDMATFCEKIFKSATLSEYDLRYFDPTISAADSHEDKGLIECLMVKSSRMLIYHTGKNDSFGKDVEAAMALCMGKPTIFFCSNEQTKANFFRNVHPLSRLVNFANGVAGGVIVCISEEEVIQIVERIIKNSMVYRIKKKEKEREYYLLEEDITKSVVRIQTDNVLLSSAFWNNY